jgi:hypothetical protein
MKLTVEQAKKAQDAYDRRAAKWDPTKWDYTEWEELFDEVQSIAGLTYQDTLEWTPGDPGVELSDAEAMAKHLYDQFWRRNTPPEKQPDITPFEEQAEAIIAMWRKIAIDAITYLTPQLVHVAPHVAGR